MEFLKNKIEQSLSLYIPAGSIQYEEFIKMLREFIENNSEHKVDGVIEKAYIRIYGKELEFDITSTKEDRLHLVSYDTTAEVLSDVAQ